MFLGLRRRFTAPGVRRTVGWGALVMGFTGLERARVCSLLWSVTSSEGDCGDLVYAVGQVCC